VELKLPVPATVAEHWLVWPICTLVGEQETVTDEIAGDWVRFVRVPPPQPAMRNATSKKRLSPTFRSIYFALSLSRAANEEENCAFLFLPSLHCYSGHAKANFYF
jgi:hypothetical protein